MTINGEPVELVTDFASLQAADVVYVQPCRSCGGRHRAFLLRFERNASTIDSRDLWRPPVRMDVWLTEPPRPACNPHGQPAALTADIVAARRLYRVVNPPLASDDAEENRALNTQRVRRKVGVR